MLWVNDVIDEVPGPTEIAEVKLVYAPPFTETCNTYALNGTYVLLLLFVIVPVIVEAVLPISLVYAVSGEVVPLAAAIESETEGLTYAVGVIVFVTGVAI